MNPKHYHQLVGPLLLLLAIGFVQCSSSVTEKSESTGVAATVSAVPDSTEIMATGPVGAGPNDPLLAHVSGRVRQVFFTPGEYVHRGQLLVKLYTRDYVLAPHDGFLGAILVREGEPLRLTTPVTTISRQHHLVVSLTLPPSRRGSVSVGDSVSVWVASRPTRVVTAVVGSLPAAPDSLAAFPLEVTLPLRAPFRIGEQASVRLHDMHFPQTLSAR